MQHSTGSYNMAPMVPKASIKDDNEAAALQQQYLKQQQQQFQNYPQQTAAPYPSKGVVVAAAASQQQQPTNDGGVILKMQQQKQDQRKKCQQQQNNQADEMIMNFKKKQRQCQENMMASMIQIQQNTASTLPQQNNMVGSDETPQFQQDSAQINKLKTITQQILQQENEEIKRNQEKMNGPIGQSTFANNMCNTTIEHRWSPKRGTKNAPFKETIQPDAASQSSSSKRAIVSHPHQQKVILPAPETNTLAAAIMTMNQQQQLQPQDQYILAANNQFQHDHQNQTNAALNKNYQIHLKDMQQQSHCMDGQVFLNQSQQQMMMLPQPPDSSRSVQRVTSDIVFNYQQPLSEYNRDDIDNNSRQQFDGFPHGSSASVSSSHKPATAHAKSRGKANSSHNDYPPPRHSNLTGKKQTKGGAGATQSVVLSQKSGAGTAKIKQKASSLYQHKFTTDNNQSSLLNKRKTSYTPASLSQKSYGHHPSYHQLIPRQNSMRENNNSSAGGRNHKHASSNLSASAVGYHRKRSNYDSQGGAAPRTQANSVSKKNYSTAKNNQQQQSSNKVAGGTGTQSKQSIVTQDKIYQQLQQVFRKGANGKQNTMTLYSNMRFQKSQTIQQWSNLHVTSSSHQSYSNSLSSTIKGKTLFQKQQQTLKIQPKDRRYLQQMAAGKAHAYLQQTKNANSSFSETGQQKKMIMGRNQQMRTTNNFNPDSVEISLQDATVNQKVYPIQQVIRRRLVRFVGLSSSVLQFLIQFDQIFFGRALKLSRSWRTDMMQAFDDYCNPIENSFVQTYFEHIFFKKSYTWAKPISFCHDRGIRIDRVFQCELVSEGPGIKTQNLPTVTVSISAKYKLFGEDEVYRAEYKFDRVKCTEKQHQEGKAPTRETWLHKDAMQRESYTRPIQLICQGDSIEFSLTLSNLNGFVEWVEWEPICFSETPNLSALTYDKDWTKRLFFSHSSQKIYCDLNRICELEDAIVEWYEAKYYQRRELFDLTFLRGQIDSYSGRDSISKVKSQTIFEVKDLQYAGVDGSICKAVLKAIRPGYIDKKYFYGIQIRIKAPDEELVNEVKRIGYIRDRECEMQLRVGDTLILYISTSIA